VHHGDVLSITGLTTGKDMDYGRLGYETLLNGLGSRLGASFSALHYVLGGSLAPLDGHGTAQVESLWAKHPFARSRDFNLYGQLQYDQMQLKDHVDASSIKIDRHLGAWTASLSGDARDAILSGGVNTWNLGWTGGRVGFDDASTQVADAAAAKTQGEFSKWTANLARLQSLSPADTLYLAFSGQWANTNLDAAEKMSVGGPFTVRAYDTGAVSGDSGYRAVVELRHDLGAFLGGQWQATAFVEGAHVTVNRNTWVAGANSATLSGAGVGLDWSGPNQWSAKAYVATPIGSTPVLVGTSKSARAWVEIGKGF
jgi:hemolysin activation/secretion protein